MRKRKKREVGVRTNKVWFSCIYIGIFLPAFGVPLGFRFVKIDVSSLGFERKKHLYRKNVCYLYVQNKERQTKKFKRHGGQRNFEETTSFASLVCTLCPKHLAKISDTFSLSLCPPHFPEDELLSFKLALPNPSWTEVCHCHQFRQLYQVRTTNIPNSAVTLAWWQEIKN